MNKLLSKILLSFKLSQIDNTEAIRRINQLYFKKDINSILDEIHDNLIDKGTNCIDENKNAIEVDDYLITFKDIRLELEKFNFENGS